MTIRFPNESSAYRIARSALLDAELALRRTMEDVAAMRRALPVGGAAPRDYVFRESRADSTVGEVKLSELFASGKNSLAIYNFMFPRHPADDRVGPAAGETAKLPLTESPCPSCTALLDQLNGAALHLSQRMNFVVVARTTAERLRTFAVERGWHHLRLLSSAGNSFNRDYFGETDKGHQQPVLNVFVLRDGAVHHFWGSELLYAPTDPGQEMRHVGTLEPLWNMLDLTPEGRGTDWEEQLAYGCCAGRSADA